MDTLDRREYFEAPSYTDDSDEFSTWLEEHGLEAWECGVEDAENGGRGWLSKNLAEWIHNEGRAIFEAYMLDLYLADQECF